MSAGNGKDVEIVDGRPQRPPRRKKSKAAPSAPKQPKDQHLPGMEPKIVPAVHAAIEEYVEARDHRMQLTKVETEKRERLMQAMKDAGVTTYRVDGHEASLEIDETVKAKMVAEEQEDNEEAVLSGGKAAS